MITIYLRTNNVNGKQYVGQTKNFERREKEWNILNMVYANKIISSDRIKYGLENFNSEILKECEDSEGDYWEEFYINKYSTIYPNGYNFAYGGKSRKGVYRHSDKVKKIISESKIGDKNPMFGVPSPFTGHHHSEETKKKMSEKKKGVPSNMCKKIYQYTKDGELIAIYNSMNEAATNTNSLQGKISSCCNGHRKTHNGYKWSFKLLS